MDLNNESEVMEFKHGNESYLDKVLREGAQKMLEVALLKEVDAYVKAHSELLDDAGKRLVVRNGYMPERELLTRSGTIKVRQPRVKDQRDGHSFISSILPKYMRKSPKIEELLPLLYLKGLSTGQFAEALEPLFGKAASGLSASTITQMLKAWEADYLAWSKRDLSGKEFVYMWADGIHSNIRLGEDERVCSLVIIGTLADGSKELVGIYDGYRESTQSWLSLLRDLKKRGLEQGPKLAIADGALGFWAALQEVYPETKGQRCWVHKTANILDKMPKKVQAQAKDKIHEIYMAKTKVDAKAAYKAFLDEYQDKYPRACECLKKDEDMLFTFYDFPAIQWHHIRTTNAIESTFATIRHRTRRTKGNGNRKRTLAMIFKLCKDAEKRWTRLRGRKLIPLVMKGVKFEDGIQVKEDVA